MNIRELQENVGRTSELLKALGNEHRLKILCFLGDGESSVGDLEPLVGLRQSALSQHLAVLRGYGLVKTRRNAQTIIYALAGDDVKEIIGAVKTICMTNFSLNTSKNEE
jgi:DNA-binding transcriptional ArsR family regulator